MNKNRQHLIVGTFVVVMTCILVGVWLWMSSSDRRVYNFYVAVFHEPVDGLSENSVIKYNGVEVGKVKLIKLDNKNPSNIYVYLNILQDVPINKSTQASLKSQGVTGMSYIDLYLPKAAKLDNNLVPHNDEPYPEIMTKPSFLYSLSEQAQTFTDNIQDVSVQVKNLLDDKNIAHISATLNNLDKLSSVLATHSDKIEKSLDTLSEILESVKDNSNNLNKTFKDLSTLSASLTVTSKNANELIDNAGKNTLQDINGVLLPNMNQAILNLNQSSFQLQGLLKQLNQNPAMLIRGRAPASPGPGE